MATAAPAAAPDSHRLDALRVRLDAIRRRRLLSRRLTGWSAVAVAVLAALLVALVIDRSFALSRAGRLWLWAGVLTAAAWSFRRHAWPLLRIRERDLDVALATERAHGIDSDFVAALQFERPEAGRWGSATLRSAVVDYVAEFGRQWTAAAPLWNPRLARRAAWTAALAAVFGVVGLASPATLAAFAERMVMGSRHYPSRTRIERLVVAGHRIDPGVGTEVRAPVGRPVPIELVCGGRTVPEARAEFTAVSGGNAVMVPLATASGGGAADRAAALSGSLASLTEPATLIVHAGDAWSEPVRITPVAVPVVEAMLREEPPAYARGTATPAAGRQVAVLEGSGVGLEVSCPNKALASVAASIGGVSHPLTRSVGKDGRVTFVLSGSGSPLAAVTAPITYEIQAVDTDGLSPDRPPAGAIRIRADAAPQVTAEAVTRTVLPTARPVISYAVKDDYGVAALRVNVEVVRDPAVGPEGGRRQADPVRSIELLRESDPPWVGDGLPKAGTVVLPLSDYGLQKGDFVRVVFAAVDHRGAAAGQPATSPPIDLVVSDENGILEALQTTESQAAQELQAIIDEQLRVGGQP